MHDPAPVATTSQLSAESLRVLGLVADGLSHLAGVARVSVLVRDGESLEVAAVGGSAAESGTVGDRVPVADALARLASAESWGAVSLARASGASDLALLVPVHGGRGDLVGLISLDDPLDGRPPRAEEDRRTLASQAHQAALTVVHVLERAVLTEQVRLAGAARRAVREASTRLSLRTAVRACQDTLLEGFGAGALWFRAFDDPEPRTAGVPEALLRASERWARDAWARQQVLTLERAEGLGVSDETAEVGRRFAADHGLATMLLVPLGAGTECVGYLLLARGPGQPAWTAAETDAALDIGHDLGRTVLNARAFEREQRLAADKAELVATLAHELNGPLTSVRGYLELLSETAGLDDDVRRGLDAAGRGAVRLENLSRDLMVLARSDDPDRPLRREPVDLRQVVDGALDLVALEASRRGVRVRLADGRDGGPHGRPPAVTAHGDRGELELVATNLISNAVKYSHPGADVRVHVSAEHHQVVMSVADDGVGISSEDQARLFSAFFRSSTVAATVPGTGLGLAIVRRIVARHGGMIDVDSAPGRGSTFRVYLPGYVAG